jgi:transcriptional regulator with XRE-family HTH domain
MSIGNKIRDLRKRKNLSQTELGNLVGVHYIHIGKYEKDQQIPSTDTLKKLAAVFEVSTDYLLNDDADNAVKVSFSDEELLREFKAVESLPDNDKTVVKELINAFLVKNQIKHMVSQ